MKANILIDDLPTSITVGGEIFKIDANFRTFVLFESLIFDSKLPERYKPKMIMELFFVDKSPQDFNATLPAILDFYSAGKKQKPIPDNKRKPRKIAPRLYDFEYDADYIYAAFLSEYRIDLNEIEFLHWWKFKALFNALPENVQISKIIGYRAADTSQIKDQRERSRIARLKNMYALPSGLSEEQKVSAIGAMFGGAK